MSTPIFKRLSMASLELYDAQRKSIKDFADSTDKVVSVVEAFFRPAVLEPSPEPRSLTEWITRRIREYFRPPPTATASVYGSGISDELTTAASTVREIQTIIVAKLNEYAPEGEGHRVAFNGVTKEDVLGHLEEVRTRNPALSGPTGELMGKLRAINETNNQLDWTKMLRIVQALHKIQNTLT